MESIYMQKISNLKFMPIFIKLFVLLILAKAFALSLLWFLPQQGINLTNQQNYTMPYVSVSLKNIIDTKSPIQKKALHTQEVYSINSLLLKGVYGSHFHGFAIIAEKRNPLQSIVLRVNENFKGYKLLEIFNTYVLFSKNRQEYVLSLDQKGIPAKVYQTQAISHSAREKEYTIHKKDIQDYSEHPEKIWREITINEVRTNGKLQGFRVDGINRNSKIGHLGLRKGDLIISANNISFQSYKNVIDFYNNLNKVSTISLTVLRNNQEQEILYEVY